MLTISQFVLLLAVFWLRSAKGAALQEVRWGLKGKANAYVSLLSALFSNSNRSISLPWLYLLKSSHRSFLLLEIAMGSQQGDGTFEKNNSKWIYLQRDYLQRYRYRATWRRKWQPVPVFLLGISHRGVWWATVHGVSKSWTQLSDLTLFPLINPNFIFQFKLLCCKTLPFSQYVLSWTD